MATKTQQKAPELKILSRPHAMAVDGNSIVVQDDQKYGDLTFFQIYNKVDNVLEAHGVATLRLTVDQLKALNNMLGKVISAHEEKTKKDQTK